MREERREKSVFAATILIISLLTGALLAYNGTLTANPSSAANSGQTNLANQSTLQNELTPPPPLVTRTLRVAIYLERNLTRPSYTTVGGMSSNTTGVQRVLQAAGCQVTNLTRADISQHKLTTASYDVFVMVDNLPRENITNLVKEFWLGGGGFLSLDSAISYLCYAGMIPPESEGSDGYNVYWKYVDTYSQVNVTARHPVTEAFGIKTKITTSSVNYATFKWAALQGTRVAGDLVKLATELNLPNNVSVVALDPKLMGGRVVQLPCIGDPITSNMTKVIVDAVSWLCPHPKARIAFDFSHRPWYGVDTWDTPYCVSPGQYAQLRNALVNRSYTFDKLYPSASGNLTASNLAPYDMLIVELPNINFTSAEVAVVANWVSGGHSLLALGDNPTLSTQNGYLNYLLSSFSLRIENAHTRATGVISYFVKHPTTETCYNLYVGGASGGYINYTGAAYPIWGSDASNAIIGAQVFGTGRVILAADVDWPTDGGFTHNNNYQYAINVANWLTASKADVLIYVYQGGSYPYRNVYRGPLASALNDLGVGFYLTFTLGYLNYTLHQQTWTLVITDQPSDDFASPNYFLDILNYMKAGGHMILNTWQYGYSVCTPLFDYIGLRHMNNFTAPPRIYVWNTAHDIFSQPNHYRASNITTTHNLFAVDCSNLTLYSNASAIAGLGKTTSTTNASIVLGAGGRAIVNAMLLTEYYDDTDNSTYGDSFEIWENEIAYMLRPQCSLTPSVPLSMWRGSNVTVQVSVGNLGLRGAMQGQVTLTVPAGLGTVQGSATQSFSTPLNPSDTSTLSWQVSITGTGSYTLGFAASYKGFKSTGYSASATAGTLAIAQPVATYFAQYGFSVVSNATNFVVDNVSSSPTAGTGEPPSGSLAFVYLRMNGTLAPGSHVAYVSVTYSKARAQQLGLNVTTLAFYKWNSSASLWQALPTVFTDLNSTHGLIIIYLTGFSYFAVFGVSPTGGGSPITLLLVGIAAVVIVVAIVVVLAVSKRRKADTIRRK